MRRSQFVAAGGAAAVAAVVSGAPARSRAQSGDDAKALGLLLLVEYTEDAFYRAALARGRLQGELRAFAETVADQEREHLAFVKRAIGGNADPPPRFDFAADALSSNGFAATAAELEDLAVAAYNGQATNVSAATLDAAATIVSVEARHAAWIRSIAGEPPAPDATDMPRDAGQVLAGLERIGLRR
jgi:rubrerythrin